MKKIGSVKLVIFFTALVVVPTWLVIFAYESFLRGPFYSWVEARYPADKRVQDRIEQRVEHYTRFILELPAEISGEAEYAESLAGRRRAVHSLDDGGTAQARRH